MGAIDFPFILEEDSGFMHVPDGSAQSLAELFVASVPDTLPVDWDLSDRDILATSDGLVEQTDCDVQAECFKKIKEGSQEGQVGGVDVGLVEDYCDALNDHSEKTHIVFSPERLENPVTGGTCSAMAFEFADDYLRRKGSMTAEEIFDEIGSKYDSSSEKFRIHQAVFNTLHREDQYPRGDFMRNKIEAMLRFYDRYVIDSSEIVHIENPSAADIERAQEKIGLFLNDYTEGVFVIRCIMFADNDKGESHGHSTILIRENGKTYFYDPNEGVYELPNDPEALIAILKPMMEKWHIPYGRIYKIH